VLNTGPAGWLNPTALKQMSEAAYGSVFTDLFQCPSDDVSDHYGFTSWDHFFTRVFKPGVRPVAAPGDNAVLTNACESAPYRLAHDVRKTAPFWIKGQPYSLGRMLNDDALAGEFEGGTLYQAFLSALSFHRWNSPVSGRIVKAYNIDGTYYAEDLYEGFLNPAGPDDAGPNDSQAFITEVAARAVILIQADNPDIGLMAFLAVGMAEVSSNEITVAVGQHVDKGDQLGMFHFGGSTHCLIFRPGVNLEFDLHGQQPGLHSTNIKLNAAIAKVLPAGAAGRPRSK
jgi:phosphatidylserine decarboxylase